MSKQLNFRFPSPSQLKNIVGVLSSKEKLIFYGAIFIFVLSLGIWATNYYYASTEKVADVGGEYTEGMVGEPIYINPIYTQLNEVDTALSQLIFSSLLKYDAQGNLVNDLTENYEVSENGTQYTFKLKPGVKWHDKKELTANDVLFTVKLIQNSAYNSSLRGDWQDITASAPDPQTVVFQLNKPYAPFLNKLTFGVLPQHLYEQIPSDKFLLDKINLEPIGSGPFVYSEFKKDDKGNIISYHLLANNDYYQDKPYLEKINFNFYSNEDVLMEAYNKKEINGFGLLSYQKAQQFANRKDTQILNLHTPRYFAVFFNPTKSKALADKEVRKALSYATDKKGIIHEVFADYAQEVRSPILNSFGQFASSAEVEKYEFNASKAEEILENAGWKKGEDGVRKKNDAALEINLITTQWPDLASTATLLKTQWEKVGAKVEIQNLSVSDIKENYIRTREYQAILYGQEYVGNDPDPYHFWHSSGKKDPGLNIAMYENQKVDKLLEESRENKKVDERQAKYAEFEKQIADDAPAVFLYEPGYVYVTNKKIKGVETQSIINPAYRFASAKNWYIKTQRIKKTTAQ